MTKRFHVTYEIFTPESVESGDCAERGFVVAGDTQCCLPGGVHGEAAQRVKDMCVLSLREAYDLVSPGAMEDSGSWFTELGERRDYRTGASEIRALHCPDKVSGATYARLKRLLHAD